MAYTINQLDTHGWWMVGSDHIYVPSTPCRVEHSNIVSKSSGRDESGVMRIDWVRRDVRKVFLKYNYMTSNELYNLLHLMQGKEFTFKFFDKGSVQEINAYAGESSYEFYAYDVNGAKVYKDVEIHVIEK